jgi:hypothetical protein
VVSALLGLAVWSVPRAIQAGDAGEFATVMLTGGVPHPSGYPWMRMLGVAARGLWALGLPPATAAALPAALCGVAAWILAHRSIRAQTDATWLATSLVVLVAAAPLVVIHVNDSEVWGLHLLFAALFIHVVLRTRARPPAFRLGIMLGLGLSHHLTAALLIPMAIGAAIPASRTPGENTTQWCFALVRNGALGIAGALLGLLPLLTLTIGRGGGWRWGDTGSAAGLFHHITRGDYGTFSLSLHQEQVAVADTIGRALTSVGEVFAAGLVSSPYVGAAVLVGAIAGLVTMAPTIGRSVAIGWGLSIAASALGFPAMQNIDPGGPFGAWILERFDLLTVMLVLVPIAAALDRLGRLGLARAEQAIPRPALLTIGARAFAVLLVFAQIGAVLERGRPASEAAVELAAIDMLETPDPHGPAVLPAQGEPIRAIIFGTDDHRSFPALYAQAVLGAGSHTLYIDAQLLAHPWYRARLRARLPRLPDTDKPLRMIGEIWADPALAATPIYLANVFSGPADRLTKVPEGLLWRIPVPADHPSFAAQDWTHDAIVGRHLAAFARYRVTPADFAGLTHPRGHPWSADLWHAYVDKSRALAAMLTRDGHGAQAKQVLDALALRTGATGR